MKELGRGGDLQRRRKKVPSMATCLQVPMVPSSLRSSSSSSSTTYSFDSSTMNQRIGWRHNRNVSKRLNLRCSSAKIPMPPVNPNDPFLKRLASFVQDNPTLKPSSNSELPPYLDLFEPPKMMAPPAQVSFFYFFIFL